jgi:hypothetical protein
MKLYPWAHWNGAEWEDRSYYGYQDITETSYEPQPITYNVTQVVKQRRWPPVTLAVPIAWAVVAFTLLLVLFL